MNLRRITSLTMLISFILLVTTSVILYIVPYGRVAYWSNWRLWGLSKTQWSELHLNLGILLLIGGLLHIYYNWKAITAYLKNKARQLRIFTSELNIALLVTFMVILGTYFHVPPMSTVLEINEAIKEASAKKYGEPPYGHAELSSLKAFTKKLGLDLNKSIALLKKAGIKFEGPNETLEKIANRNGIRPKDVYEIIKAAASPAELQFPEVPPPGFGMRTVHEISKQFNIPVSSLLGAMKTTGIKAEGEDKIKEIAKKNGLEPMAIFEIIREAVTTPAKFKK